MEKIEIYTIYTYCQSDSIKDMNKRIEWHNNNGWHIVSTAAALDKNGIMNIIVTYRKTHDLTNGTEN